ncbi:MAG: flagellar hook basal-body protein [Anaerohalosphaeraceae bacterium]
MSESISQLGSGINALMEKYMAVSNNIANASTPGFKRTVNTFSSTLYEAIANQDKESLAAAEICGSQSVDFSQGQILRTERPLDVALEGRGFLVLETPTGPLYTRSGSLDVNKLGQLVDINGNLVAGQNGPIIIPRDVSVNQVTISLDGIVRAGETDVGALRLVSFGNNTSQLEPVGLGAYRAPADVEPEAATNVKVRQGCQESSNVKIMDEMVSMMTLSRIYEMHINILKRQRENSSVALGVANSQG